MKKVPPPYRPLPAKEYTPSPEMRWALERAAKVQPPIKSINNKQPSGGSKPDEGGK